MIKPCPFCNGVLSTDKITWSDGSSCYRGICSECGSRTKAYDSEQQAIDAWNQRPREEELLKVIREIVYSGKEPETISSKLDNALILLGKYRGENER